MKTILNYLKKELKEMWVHKLPMAVVSVSFLCAIGSCTSCMWKADSPLEEAIEELIEDHTGVEVDFSPEER